MTAQDTPNASTLDAAQVRLRENLASFDAEVDWQMSSEAERADLWEEIDVNVDDLRTVLDALAALQQQLSEARAELKNRWQRMDSAPRDGTRILLAWEPYSGISEHVELGKWKSQNGWCNTYGKPFSGEPDAWAALAPFSLSPEAAEAKLATMAKPVDRIIPNECRSSLIARAVRQSLRRYGHKVAESSLPDWIANDVEASLKASALFERDAPQAIDPIISWMVTHGWLDADAEYSTADLIRALDDNYTEVGDAPQAQAVKALGDTCQLFEGFDDAAKIMITAKSSKGGSVKLDGPALTVGALRALTRPSTTEAKPVDPKLIENVAYICGQWEKNQGASSLTIAVRLLLAALDNDKEQSE